MRLIFRQLIASAKNSGGCLRIAIRFISVNSVLTRPQVVNSRGHSGTSRD